MILLPTGCNEIIDVSTDNIRVTIKRRKTPALTSDVLLSQKSKLEVWGGIRELKIGNEICGDCYEINYASVDVAPLFFEQSDYLVNACSLNGCPLRFEHSDKNIREALSVPFDDPSMLSGTINFGSEVGYSNLIFSDVQGNRLLIQIEVFPSKLSYKEDYEAIRNDVNEMVEAAAIDFINSTYTLATVSTSKNSVPAIFFTLINQLFGKFYKATTVIMSKPKHELITERNIMPVYKVKKTDMRTYLWLEKHPENIRMREGKICANCTLTAQKRITYDTVENQLVKFILSTIIGKLSDFKRKYLMGFRDPQKSADPEILSRIDTMISKIRIQLRNPIFEEVSSLNSMNTMSLVFQMAPGYRELYRYFQLIQRGITFSGEVYNFSMKDTATLYEYWCFIKLVNIMKEKYTLIDNENDIIKVSKKGVTVTLSKNRKSIVKFIDTKTGDKFKLIYNPGDYPSDTVKQVPDNVLSLEKSTDKEGKTAGYQYVFDAKYKVEMNPDEHYPDDEPGPKITDINTMHRYRDAIVSTEGKLNEKLMFGAYVLFPYPKSEEEYKKHRFYKSIETVNIGGIPFLPGKTQIAEELLTKLIGESDASAFERSILPKGIEDRLAKVDWVKRDVLIGSLSSKAQLEEVLKGKYYYIPVKSMQNERHQVNYVGLYQSQRLYGREAGILYYGEVLQTEIRPRKEINNLPGRTAPEEACFFFSIKEWKELGARIEFESEWVYKPRYTNMFLLQNCRKTFELFNIRSAEDYRLVTELRRIQKHITVQDNTKDLFVKFNESVAVYNDEEYIYVYIDGKVKLKKSTKIFGEYPGLVFREIQELIDATNVLHSKL